MKDPSLVDRLRVAHEQHARLVAKWYDYDMAFSHYTSDFLPILVIALMNTSDEDLARRLKEAAAQYKRLHDDTDSPISFFSNDTVPLLLLAAMPADEPDPVQVIPAVSIPQETPVLEVMDQAVEPAPAIAMESASPRHQEDDPAVEITEVAEEPAPPTSEVTSEKATRPCSHVGTDGKCLDCTGDQIETCEGCVSGENEYPICELVQCKDEECRNNYCTSCRKNYLSERGYCSDHDTITCDGCNGTINRDNEICCSRQNCNSGIYYCTSCASCLLTVDGRCSECSSEEIETCDSCGETYIDSRLTPCKSKDCNNAYCAGCRDSEIDPKGYCSSCEPDEEDEDFDDEDEDDDEDDEFDLDDEDDQNEDDEDDVEDDEDDGFGFP
jgi:hypothetical protein